MILCCVFLVLFVCLGAVGAAECFFCVVDGFLVGGFVDLGFAVCACLEAGFKGD